VRQALHRIPASRMGLIGGLILLGVVILLIEFALRR